MLPDGLLTSAEYKHDVDIAPCVLELDPFASDDCLDDLSPPRPFLLTPFEELNTMNMSDDEPSSVLNGRLRPRKSAVQSPQTTKAFRRSESRSSQERPKRTSTPSKVLTKTDDLANKSESSPPHYLCPFCDKKFAAKQAISKHVHRMHSKQAPVMGCLFCNHAEAEPTDIIRHMVDSHPNQYFACLDCHTRFPSTTELAEHKLNVCEKQKLPYRNKLRQKAGKSKKGQKSIKIDDKDFETDSKTFPAGHGFNGIVISCELKPSQVHDDADIEDNITTNLILPPSKTLGSSAVLDKNAVIVLDDIQWNKRIPSNFSFHNTDADQILSRLGVVHRSPRTGEPTRRDWLRTIDDATQKFEKCFDTSFYSKVASNVQENLNKFLDGSFNFNPDPDSMIKTRKSKMSVVINTAEGFPILLACEQYSRNAFDGYMPRAIAPRHKWKWDNLETDRTTLSADQIKRDSHTNNCIITLVSSLDIWTQLCMRRKYEEKYSYSPLAKKTDKQTATENELKEILESREIPTTSSQVIKQRQKPPAQNDAQDFPACLGLAPSTPKYELPPAVLSGEWVRPRCYVCCACGTPTYDSRALSAHMATRHPNAQVQHYEVVGELLLNADILKHLYVPPSQMHNRTRPLRGIRECTKCKKSITLEDLHQHMLDCAGDTPAVRRKCRYRPFGVRKRRPRLPDNRIRKKMRKDIRNRQNNQKTHMRARPRANRSEVGDAETIRKMLADLPAKRHRVLVNPMNSTLRPRRKLDKHRNKLLMKRHQSDDTKNRKLRTMKTNSERSGSSAEDRNSSPTGKYDDDDDKPLKRPVRRVPVKGSRQKEAMKRKAVLNRARRKLNAAAEQASVENETPDIEVPNTSGVEINQISIQNNSQRLDVNSGSYNSRENSNRGSHGDDGSNNREQPPPGHNDQNGNSNNQRGDQAQNTPLKHSIARLTADCETHNKPVEFHHAFTIQQDCSDLNQHVPSEHRLQFENEAAATKLDKPPLDLGTTQKSKKNKVKRLNDCIAMLRMKNKLTDSGSGESTSTPQADNDDQRGDKPLDRGPTQAPIDDKPAEIFHRHNINDLAMDRQFERPYEYTREGKFIPPMNHPIPIPYEMIPIMMGMPQPEDLRVVQAMETPSKPKTRRSSTRAQQRRATRPSLEAIPTIPPFMIPANPYEMAMAPPIPYPGQVSQRRSSASRMLVNVNTETNRPPTLDLPSPNRLSPRQVSPRQISPRQMMMNIEMMRDMNYDRPSPNKLSPLQIFTPDIRARSELRSPRQSHAYDPQFLSRVGHRQISPRHGLEIDPRRLAMELYQHSNQPSVPTQISPIQVAQAHALYASKLAQMPVSYRQTSPVPDYKVPRQISPMQDNQCYDIPSLYKVPKQVSPKQLSQAFDTFPPSKLPSPRPKHTEQALDNLANKKVHQCSSKNPDQALDKQLPSKVIPPGSSKQGTLPLDLQLSNKIPSSGQASSKQGNHASDLISKTPTEIQDSSKHVSEAPTPGQILGLDSSSKPAILALDSSTKMSVPIQESSESASQALDLQLKSCQLPVSGQSSTQKVSQDFDLHSSNKMPSPGQDATKHGCQISETPKKLTSQGSESETSQESNHASDLQSSSKMSSTGHNPSKLASQVVEKSKITASVESSNPITKISDIQASENSAPSPPQQESQVAEQQPSRKLPSNQVSPRSASQAYEMQSHSRSSNFISSKQVDLSPDIQPNVRQSPKNVSNQSSSTQAQDITTETKIPKQQEQPSKHVNQRVTLKAKPIEELQSKPKTRASSRSSQGPTSRTRATRASSRALKLRSSSQPDPALEITELQSQTRESHAPSRESNACSQLIQSSESEMRETDAQKREFNPKIREHQTHESTPQTPEHYHLKRKSPLQSREPKSQAREPHSRTGERQTLEPHIEEHKTLEFDTQMQNPHPQTREPIPKMRESHQSREPQTQESLTKEFQMRETKMLESQMWESQMRESQMRESQMRESQMRESQMRESQMRESQMRESQMLESQMLESQMLESQMRESQIRESQMRESQMRESQLRESQMFENQMRESQMRESQMRESQMREAQIRESQMRESQILESQILESQIREFQMRESQMLLQQMCEPHPQAPFPQMRESYSRSRDLHVQAQHHEQIRESQAHAQSNTQVREQNPHTRESRTPTQEPQMRELLAYRQDTQAREIHAQQSGVHTQPRESQIQHREPHVQGHNHNQPQDSYAKSRRGQPRETQLELGDPQIHKQDFSHQSLDQNTQQRDSYGPPQSHHHKRVPHVPQEPQAQNRESHLLSREPHIQQQETNVQLRHHALSQSLLQTEEPQIGMRDHDHSQTRESQTQETYAQTQSNPQTREMLLRERESNTQHRDPLCQHTNPLEAHTPLQEPPAKHQSHSQTRSPRIKAQESYSLSQEELIQLREPHSQLRDLHTQLREPEPPLRETHGQSLESHTQSQREFYSHTHLQSQSQSTQRPYLLFAPPPPPPPPEDTQQVITQIQLETPQQPWQSNVFDMSMIRQASADAANEQIARNMSVEMYSETEYPHMHPSIPLAHTGNLLDNLPLVPLDLSSKTPEACENARKLETSYVSHYERYETLDLSNKNIDLTKRDEDVVVDLRVKPTSQSSSISLHELSDIPVDEMVDVTDAYPKDLSVKKHIDTQNITNNQAYDDQDFSNDQVVETPTDLSGRIIPVSSHYLLNANDARLLPMTDQFSHSAKDGLPLMSNMDEEPETANSFAGKRQNEIASTFANIFIPPPPPPPPPPQEDTQTDEIEKSNSIQKQEAEHTSQLPEHKIKTSNTPDLEKTSDDLRSQANKTPDVHATVSNNASLTCSPGYTSPNPASSAQSSNRHDAEYALAKAFMSVSSKTGNDDVSTDSLISRFSYSIPSTTTANTSSVYTLASTSRGLTSNSGKSSQVGCENALEIERQINTEQDPETARKIALLPKELVEILGNMPPDHRNQLLNVLPQYVSHTTSSDQSNSHKQVDDASNTTDLSKIPLPAGSGPTTAKFLQSKPVSKFESSVNYQNTMVPPESDNIYSAENVSSPKLSDNLEPDVKHSLPLPQLLGDVNKSDDVKPGIRDKITVSENKIEVINLEKSETAAEVYNNPTIIDLTEDDNSPTNPIVNIVKTSEGFPPNIVVTPTILPAVKLTEVTKVKTTNEKTSSLRAVRIKTPLERHKSVSTDLQDPKNILEKDSTALDDNELTRKTLAIQQSEVSSTQQQKKDAVKLSSQLSPTVTELNAEATEPVKIQQNVPAEQLTQDEIENKPVETKAVLVSSSISTSGLLVDKQSMHKIISSDVQINLTPCDLNKTVLNDNQNLRITVSDHSMQSTSRLIKDCTEVKTNSKGKKNVQDDDEDSDDDISLAVIVKQKQLDQPSTFKSDVLDSKHDADRKKKRKDKYTKKRPIDKHLLVKEKSGTLNNLESVESATAVNADRDKNQNLEESETGNISYKSNILTRDEEKLSKKKTKKSRRGKKIFTTSSTNVIDPHNLSLHESIVDHNSVSSSSNKDQEVDLEMKVTGKISPSVFEDESQEFVYSQKRNKTKKKIGPKLSQSPLPISPLKTKKILSDYDNSVLDDQDDIRYNCKRIAEPDSCSIIELSDTQDSLMLDSVNTEESNSESITEPRKYKTNTRLNKSKRNEFSNDSEQTSKIIDNLVTPLRRSRRGKSLFVDKLSDPEGITQTDLCVEQKTPLTKKQLIFSKLLLDEENTKPHSLSPLEIQPENPEDCPNIPQSTAEVSSNINKNLEPTTEESQVIEMEVTDDFQENNKSKEIEELKQETTKELKASKSDVTAINNETDATENISEKESCSDASEYQKVLEKDTLELALEKNKATKRRQSPQVKRKVKKPKSVESSEHTLEDMDTDSSNQQAADSESEKANSNLNSTKSKKDTFDKTDSNNVISQVASSENKAKLEINKPPSSAEKRKNSEYTEVEQITKHKKCRFNYKETNNKDPVSEHPKPTTDKCATKDKNTTSTNIEVRTTCYKPVAARRTRSKSAVVKSSAEILYDPYDIDFDEMIQRNEPISKKGKSSITKTVPSSYLGNTSTPIKGTSAKAQKKVPNVVEDETLRDDIMDEDIRGNISDSDDSSKSDVPLQKYVEEKGKRMSVISPSKVLDDDTDTEQELGGDKNNSNDSKSSRKTLAVCNNVEGGAGQSETEEQLRSEQFMESFGFFSERKPRKSNLLASKKISETFHIIANESDDVYFGYKDRSSKKMHQESKKNDEGKHSKSNKKETKRGRKKKSFVKPEPCYCHVCKKEFRRPDNFLRHQMSLIHISKLSEVEFKVKALPIHEEPNYLIAYKQYLDRLKALTDKLAKKKKHKGSRKIKLPTVEEILADLNKTIREQQFSQRGLSNDEALFLDCCELLQEMPIKNDKSNTDTSLGNSCQTSSNEMQIEKNLDDTKSDGDVDSITAKTILESEEVRNLENDLISNLKEAASANAAKSKLKYQQVLVAESQPEPIETSANLREAQYEQVNKIEIPEKTEKPVSEKSKREREILVDEKEFVYKEKMYPDIIEDIDMFEDKFDKIKRKCRSQAAAAKQTQVIPEPSESHKSRRKSDKKKGKKTKKSHQSSQVPTKGALKGFDGVKVSISPNDISMTNISPAAEEKEKDRDKEREKDKDKEKDRDKNREKEREKDREKERDKEKDRDKDKEKDKEKKKKKKGSSKKKRDKKDSESSSKYDSDQKNKEISTQKKIDVYEFMDNEDAELFEFRPSTLMERFKNLSKDSQSTSTANLVADEVDMSSESASDGDDFVYMSDDYVCSDDETENSLLSCEMGTGKVGKEKTSSPLKRKDAVEKNAVMGKIFKHNAVRSEKKVSKSKDAAKSKANLDQLFDSLLEDEPSLSTGKGDSSPQKELTEAESYSSLPGSTYEPSSSKYEPPSRYEPSTSKFEPSTSRYESSSSKYEPSTSKAESSSTKFEPSPSTSKYEPSPSTSKHEPSTSKPSTSKYEPQTSRYEPSTSKYEPLTVTSRDSSEKEFAMPQKITSSHRYESMPSTSKRPQRPSLQAEEFRFSPRKYDSTDEDYGPSTSKRFESSSSDVDYGPSSSKKYDMKSPQDCKLFSPKKFDSRKYNTDTSKGNECSTSRYSSTSMRNEDGSFKRRYSLDKSPRRKSEEEFSSTYDYGADVFEDDAGVARQRARRKCTVGKQNVLAESWSSESEPERAPPRPTSAESVLSSGGRKKKGRKKESQPLGGRRGKVTFRRQEFESRVSSSNRNTSSGGGGSSYTEYGSGTSSSVSTGVQVSLSPGAQPGPSGVKPRSRAAPFAWPDADDEQEHLQQHGWIVGDSHKKLVTMLAHAKGRKRNNDDKRHLVE